MSSTMTATPEIIDYIPICYETGDVKVSLKAQFGKAKNAKDCPDAYLRTKFEIPYDIEKYIKPLKRNNEQYGWYVYIDRVKADFGGVHIPLDKSKISAIEFIQNLKNHLAKHLVAGSP